MMNSSLAMSKALEFNSESGAADKFQSSNGNVIILGGFKKYDPARNAPADFSVTRHKDGPQTIDHAPTDISGALSQTRFHSGFQRKSEKDIRNPVADSRLEYADSVSTKSLSLSNSRRELLREPTKSCGYNIVTNNINAPPDQKTAARHSKSTTHGMGIRTGGDGLGFEAPNRGRCILRDSAGRYFAPQYSGANHESRQDVLLREGIKKPKMHSIIQLGKEDVKSAGLNDQFSKSGYVPKKSFAATHGLSEMCVPGTYSPTKQPNNPSGNASTILQWGKGVSLNKGVSL